MLNVVIVTVLYEHVRFEICAVRQEGHLISE